MRDKPGIAETPTDRTPEYRKGRQARCDGSSVAANPYPLRRGWNNRRYEWFLGWYDKRAEMSTEVPAEATT